MTEQELKIGDVRRFGGITKAEPGYVIRDNGTEWTVTKYDSMILAATCRLTKLASQSYPREA